MFGRKLVFLSENVIVLAENEILGIGVLYFLEKKETDISGRKYHGFGRKVHISLTKLAFLGEKMVFPGENVLCFGECWYVWKEI